MVDLREYNPTVPTVSTVVSDGGETVRGKLYCDCTSDWHKALEYGAPGIDFIASGVYKPCPMCGAYPWIFINEMTKTKTQEAWGHEQNGRASEDGEKDEDSAGEVGTLYGRPEPGNASDATPELDTERPRKDGKNGKPTPTAPEDVQNEESEER